MVTHSTPPAEQGLYVVTEATKTLMRTYKFRLHPTPEQDARMRSWCGVVRAVYNAALTQREWYGRAVGTDPHGRDSRFNSYRQCRDLKHVRAEFEWAEDCPATALHVALHDLEKAFQNFFSGRSSYPSARKKNENESFQVPCFVSKPTVKGWFANVVFGRSSVRLPKLGRVAWTKHKHLRGSAKTATVIREGEEWYVCIAVERTVTARAPATGMVGVDVGVAVPFMTNEGEALPFQRTPESLTKRKKRLQRELSRCKRGSRRRAARRAKLAKMERYIAARRKAQMHVVTTDLARRFGFIAIEDLRVANMTRSAAGTVEEPGKNVRQKSGLNRAILDVSPGMFRMQLTYKVDARSGTLVAVDPKNTSRTCPKCGHVDADNRKTQALFCCVNCGYTVNADANAGQNILDRAIAYVSAGSGVGPRKTPSEPRRRSATSKPNVSPSMGRATSRTVRPKADEVEPLQEVS